MRQQSSTVRPLPVLVLGAIAYGAIAYGAIAYGAIACGAGSDMDGPAAFVSVLGTDTITVEVFTVADGLIQGTLVDRNPATHRADYVAELGPDGAVTRFEGRILTGLSDPEGQLTQSWTVEMTPSAAIVTRTSGSGAGPTQVEVNPGAIPSLGRATTAMWVVEQAIRQASAAGQASAGEYPFQLVSPTQSNPGRNSIVRLSADSVRYSYFGDPILAVTDGDRLLSVDGTGSTTKVVVTRVPASEVDVEALATEWAARDARGEGLGVPSPAATVEGTVDGAIVHISYSQPAKRGREIWGALVPHGEVWRTGANAATQLSTDADLTIGDLAVPAGTYSLWSIYTTDSAELIVNRGTNQWGTQYDAPEDLGRTAMTRTELPDPVERFTISIVDGELRLEWDRTRFAVPVSGG